MTNWWQKPRRVSVLVDNPSWIVPAAKDLVRKLNKRGEQAVFVDKADDIQEGGVAIFLSCIHIVPDDILARNHRNILVHESDLPHGRGFSPLTWQILEGRDRIPVCLLDAAAEVDAGNVIFRDEAFFQGHELIDEMRAVIAEKTAELCLRFFAADTPPASQPQTGEASWYPRRRPQDSRLDPDKSITEQFNLLRVVDNQAYPAFFEIDGVRYTLKIEKQ